MERSPNTASCSQKTYEATDLLRVEIQQIVKLCNVRVLPGVNPFRPNDPPSVGVSAECYGLEPKQYITELAKAGHVILTHGGYGIHVLNAKQSMSNRPNITVLRVPGKPPRTDITIQDIYDVCAGVVASLPAPPVVGPPPAKAKLE